MSTATHPRNTLIQALGSLAGLILLLIWMQGGFSSKVPPGTAVAAEGPAAANQPTATVRLQTLDELRSWPGTVTARNVAQLAPKVTGRILDITVKTGETVKAGQLLVKLDDRELQARLAQSRSSLAAASAEAARAEADARRIHKLFDHEAATRQSLEAAQAAAQSGTAQAGAAKAAVAEAESVLRETALRAPFDGTVVARMLDPGALAMPGAPVLTVQSSQRLRAEADIPAECSARLEAGTTLSVRVDGDRYDAVVEEVAPAADARSRTVHVKAGLLAADRLRPGGFAWIDQPCGRREVLLVPEAAVFRSGQIESVRLSSDGKALLRHVRTGKAVDGSVEILSGLKEGDKVVLEGAK